MLFFLGLCCIDDATRDRQRVSRDTGSAAHRETSAIESERARARERGRERAREIERARAREREREAERERARARERDLEGKVVGLAGAAEEAGEQGDVALEAPGGLRQHHVPHVP